MHLRLYKFLENNKVIYQSQFGFQRNKSTTHSLIEIVESICTCIENKHYGCGIFIDLKKAFDTVNSQLQLSLQLQNVCVYVCMCVCRIFLQKSGRAPDLTPGQNFLFWVLSCSPGKYLGGIFHFFEIFIFGPVGEVRSWSRTQKN